VCVLPMSTKIPDAHKRSRQHAQRDRFEPTAEPRPLTESDLGACRQPSRNLFELAESHERVMFAVAVRAGRLIVDTATVESDIQANAVLYLTEDGSQAVERHISGASDDLGLVPRAIVADRDALEAVGAAAKRFAPVVRRHPEV